MSEQPEFPVPLATDDDVAAFIARYGTPYDPAADDYHREPFIADIREGKNDPIYNAHSYHTKVPPRAIIPYILHYTKPGDIILDPFCGSGMTGVAALMCADPPPDVLAAVPDAAVGSRRVLLNDLAPAACHIAYNYCHPADPVSLRTGFQQIEEAVREEFQWLYGTEHYEPAVGIYEPESPEVVQRLKNPPPWVAPSQLVPEDERTWELLERAEVERRLGTDLLARRPLPEGVQLFICIPATIQHTVWSDVYRCAGMITSEEPTGRVNAKTGQPVMKKVRRARGCGASIVLWDAAVDASSGAVRETFACPTCGQPWQKAQLKRSDIVPVLTNYKYTGLKVKKGKRRRVAPTTLRAARPTSALEKRIIRDLEEKPIPYWFPANKINTDGPQYHRNALSARNVKSVADFYTRRNLRALAVLWDQTRRRGVAEREALVFLFTSGFGCIERMTRYRFRKGGNGSLAGQLYFPSFSAEDNVLRQASSKLKHIAKMFDLIRPFAEDGTLSCVTCSHAGWLRGMADNSIDYVFADPPFGSNIYYSEVNWLYECWLGRLTDAPLEAVVHRKNDRGNKEIADYRSLMAEAFREVYRVLKPGRFATIEFNNSDGQVFEAVKEAVRGTGFVIENMLFLDKQQKTFKQIKGEKGEEDVVGHDVLFNLHKPAPQRARQQGGQTASPDAKLENLVAETIRDHLRGLPARIKADPRTYTQEHRTTPFLNTVLMNTILKDVNVERINLPFIDAVCNRYFKKIDGRWFLPEELVTGPGENGLFKHDAVITDETTAIQWLRERLASAPLRIGELRPHWMKATVRLTNDLSTRLERLLRENFWLDRHTRRWRLPTREELAQMNNVERQHALHDAERFLAGGLREQPADMEILGWIGHLYEEAAFQEQEAAGLVEEGQEADMAEEAAKYYGMMTRLLPRVLKEHVEPAALATAQRQCRVAARKLDELAPRRQFDAAERQPTLFDKVAGEP
jgi:DNA modification methylase